MGTEPPPRVTTDSPPRTQAEQRTADPAPCGDSSRSTSIDASAPTACDNAGGTPPADPYGLDHDFERAALPILDWLCRSYFRVDNDGLTHLPETGRCLVVANHSGTLPLDGLMLRTLVRLEHPSRRGLRWLTSDFVHAVPLLGSTLTRLGAVRETPANAERLVLTETLVAVFPEGIEGIGKLYRDRYRVQRFGGGGFVRLALRTRTPLVPCAIIGAEETSPMLYRLEILPRLLGLPYLPITPTFPLLGPAGLMPAPTKWRIVFGPPLPVSGYRADADRDPALVARLSGEIRDRIQDLLDRELARRRTIWRG